VLSFIFKFNSDAKEKVGVERQTLPLVTIIFQFIINNLVVARLNRFQMFWKMPHVNRKTNE